MTREEFFTKLKETIEVEDTVNESCILKELQEWDSLAAISTLSLMSKHLGFKPRIDDFVKCTTMKDILDLANKRFE